MILPVRDFDGMSRLSGVLSPRRRTKLSRALCSVAVSAARNAELDVVVISSSPDVTNWAEVGGLHVWSDPGRGLSAAASAAVARMGRDPWIVLHADLPLVSAAALRQVSEACEDAAVLVPSHDGGTNVIASHGPFPFSYGLGSFHRHFAAVPDASIISTSELSIDIDSPAQLAAFPELVEPPSLST
ncbi:MAG: hypothetical protein BMS9Abin12_0513 [Acidimicrobiia bacterium]|nr:MAG: hypothetical protein BMS9Abin12_0513 [Acidimicrobiia bacterium]